MADSDFLKPEVIVRTALGLLERSLTLPQLVWRDPVGDFANKKDDTITIRLPAYVNARERELRSGDARQKDTLHERSLDMKLTTDVYLDVAASDEMLTLDIVDFAEQVLNPMIGGMSRKIEDKLVAEITDATYENEITFVRSTDTPYADVAIPARTFLNNAYVPVGGRRIVCGSELEASFLLDDQFIRADHIGPSAESTVREALIGRVAGFDVYISPAIPSDEAYAFHSTAYALSNRAPIVPAGAPYGAVSNYNGLAMRFVRVFDPDAVEDRLIFDSWLGTKSVTDIGRYDGDPDDGGKFLPVDDPDDPITGHTDDWLNDDDRLVRAVKITVV